MIRTLILRLMSAIFIVFLASSAIFFVANGIGDPAVATLGPSAHPAQLQSFRERHGLDRPLLEQYAGYIQGAMRMDLGRSFRDNQPVTQVILTRLPRTMLLGGMALTFEILFGLVLGTLAAIRRNTSTDTILMGVAFLGISVPSFLTGPIFLYVFAFRLGYFPIGGYGADTLDHIYHGLLPALTMAIIGAATYARVMRSEMIETMQADFVRTARAKGLSEARVILGHALRNALLPIVTLLGLSLPFLVGGAIITESIFNWPGMGRLAIESIHALDVPMIMGVVLFASMAVQIGNLFADLAVGLLDPRVRVR